MSVFGWDITTGEEHTIRINYDPIRLATGSTSTPSEEYWNVEWFNTMPWQFTEFVLPRGQDYLVTSGFRAPEAVTHIFDGCTNSIGSQSWRSPEILA